MKNWKVYFSLVLCLFVSTSCSKEIVVTESPIGKLFPVVTGESLAGQKVEFPIDIQKPAVLLVGYIQNAQFDGDRWLYGLLSSKVSKKVAVYEVPTIKGFVPRLLSGYIDEGMRSGIPKEDWGIVVTVYENAEKIMELTGNDQSRNMRVILLDKKGRVRYFHDRGFSAGQLINLEKAIDSLGQ